MDSHAECPCSTKIDAAAAAAAAAPGAAAAAAPGAAAAAAAVAATKTTRPFCLFITWLITLAVVARVATAETTGCGIAQ